MLVPFLRLVFASAAAAAAAAAGGVKAGPNFIILLADDYGWGDPSPPLSTGVGQTPELNAMAAAPGAAHFPRSYIGGSVCSPSRAALLSGRSCSRDCVISVESMALPLQLQGNTLADVARASGRATFFAGSESRGEAQSPSVLVRPSRLHRQPRRPRCRTDAAL